MATSMLFGLRFDFRNPEFASTSAADRYAAALDIPGCCADGSENTRRRELA